MAIRYDITVNWEVSPRIITVASPSVELTIQDLVDTCRFLESDILNMDDPYLISAAGKEPLGGSAYVGITVTLQNAVVAFEARPGPTYAQCKINGGNLVAIDDTSTPINPIYPTAFTQVNYEASTSPTLVVSSTSGVGTPTEVADAVWNAVSALYQSVGTMGSLQSVTVPTAGEVADAVWDELSSGHLSAGSMGKIIADTKTVIDTVKTDTENIIVDQATAISLIQTLLKYSKNRTRIDKTAKTLTIYDDDTLTPIKVFDLKDSTGAPSITEIIERSPQ